MMKNLNARKDKKRTENALLFKIIFIKISLSLSLFETLNFGI